MNKVVIIGCGNVGMSYAYCLLNQKTEVKELVLVDLNKDRIEGEAMDLNHCLPFAPNKMKIYAGDYKDCKDATIVAIAAIAGLFALLWPYAKNMIVSKWNGTSNTMNSIK